MGRATDGKHREAEVLPVSSMPSPPDWLTRLLLRLPDSWLLRMAGGKPTIVEGRRLDPALQLLTQAAKNQPHAAEIGPAAWRAAANRGMQTFAGPRRPGVAVEELAIPGPAGDIPALLYRPPGLEGPVPLLLFYHQGGFVIGTPQWCDSFCSLLSDTARCLVVNVDYRLAPEHRFPAAHEDALATWRWACEEAKALGGDPERLAVGGESAGGNLAAMLSHEAKRSGGPQPVCQLLVYPWVEGRANTTSYRAYADAWPLDLRMMDWFLDHLFERPEDIDDPRLNPLRETDFSGLPPALIAGAGFDPIVDEGKLYAEKLEAAGVPVDYRCYDALTHSFLAMGAVPSCLRAQREIAGEVARALRAA